MEHSMQYLALTAALAVILVSSCSSDAPDYPIAEVGRVAPQTVTGPASPGAAWDHKEEGAEWTRAVLAALDGPGAALVDDVPRDAARFCPAFEQAERAERKAFWVAFLSALAEKESTWREDVSGGGGRWHGLLQISPATAKGYGCRADSVDALKDGPANLRCAVRIMAATVGRDGVIAEGGGGVAADWGPLARAGQRDEIAAFTRAQDACQSG